MHKHVNVTFISRSLHHFGLALYLEGILDVHQKTFIIAHATQDRNGWRNTVMHFRRERQKQTFPRHCDGPTAVANDFAHHFADKIESIHRQLHNTPAAVTNPHPGNVALPLLSFQPASLEDVTTLIRNGKTKSSKIDP